VLSPSDTAYPLLKANPTGRELEELFTTNLFELGFAGQNTMPENTLHRGATANVKLVTL